MNKENQIIRKVSHYVENLLCNQLPLGHIFHNIDHTRAVVKAVEEICDFLSTPDKEKEIVLLAAWFHDCGHIKICTGHEEESKLIANSFLKNLSYPESKITMVLQCIEATKWPQNPVDILGQILCDADLYHLSTNNYFELIGYLREEWALIRKENYSNKEWFQLNLNFLQAHQYFTDYGKQILEFRKYTVIEKLKVICEINEE